MKKLLLFLVTILLPIVARADAVEIDGIYYNLIANNKVAKVTSNPNKYSGDIVIPETITYAGVDYAVTEIEGFAFHENDDLLTVKLPNSILDIRQSAFSGSSLKTISLGSNLQQIWSSAFQECLNLEEIVIPDNVKYISSQAFYGCTNLKSLVLGYNLLRIGPLAFANCSKLENVCFPTNLEYIGSEAFKNCVRLETINFLSSIENLSSGGEFSGCISLKEVQLPNSIKKIGYRAFEGCSSLSTIILPENLQEIGREAFEDCSSLSTFEMPNSVTEIGDRAFWGCENLSNIKISEKVNTINEYTFYACKKLTSIEIPNSVTLIGNNAFERCDYLETIILGKGIATILNKALYGYRLMNLYCYAPNTPSLTGEPFYNVDNTILYVPESSKENYKTAEKWKDFKEIIGMNITTFKLKYYLDGELYREYDLEEGDPILPESAPTKEGHTFCSWSEIPETMPAHDVTVTGSFTINTYKLIYVVDGEEYKSYEVEYGTSITPEAAPTNEGYTFGGWSEIPEIMPAHDVTVAGSFTVNKYTLTYKVDGAEYKTAEVEYGADITAETAPTKEGYTFSGWSEIPATMPAKDVTVTGSFTVNKYALTYKVDGAEYKTAEVEYGADITAETAPTKEGYTFSGWSEIPETMPAKDVTITGSFTVNKYNLTYKVGSETYKTVEVEYGASITPETAPTKEGYTFSGWSKVPETMPTHDVTVTGIFSINSYKLTYMIDDKVYKEDIYEYGATIIPEPRPEGDYETFEWTDLPLPQTMPAHDVVVHANYTSGIIDILMTKQRNVRIYSLNGEEFDKPQKGINIVILDDGTVKKIVVK